MDEGVLNDESIAWPSYVDFLTSFVFVLIMFVTWTVNLVSGVERERAIRASLEKMRNEFHVAGFDAVIEGHKLKIPLANKVSFSLSKAELDESGKINLRKAGTLIAAHPDVKWIIVQGYSDRVKARNDEFFNWTLSVNRAEAVLKFLYSCTDCNYKPEEIRPKLALYGSGDRESQTLKAEQQTTGVAEDRHVDIILDRGDNGRP